VIKVFTPDCTNDPLDERMGHRGIGYRLDFAHVQYSQVRQPAMAFEQWVIVRAQCLGWIGAGDGLVEHFAHSDSIDISSVNAEANDTSAPLVDDNQNPMRLQC